MVCPALRDFSTLSHQRPDFLKKKVNEHKLCVLFSLQLSSETFYILRSTYMYGNKITSLDPDLFKKNVELQGVGLHTTGLLIFLCQHLEKTGG